jgi:hypothetical protein
MICNYPCRNSSTRGTSSSWLNEPAINRIVFLFSNYSAQIQTQPSHMEPYVNVQEITMDASQTPF